MLIFMLTAKAVLGDIKSLWNIKMLPQNHQVMQVKKNTQTTYQHHKTKQTGQAGHRKFQTPLIDVMENHPTIHSWSRNQRRKNPPVSSAPWCAGKWPIALGDVPSERNLHSETGDFPANQVRWNQRINPHSKSHSTTIFLWFSHGLPTVSTAMWDHWCSGLAFQGLKSWALGLHELWKEQRLLALENPPEKMPRWMEYLGYIWL